MPADDPTLLPPPSYSRERADQVYVEAFQRAMEFAVFQRVPGDVLEFGTYNGYTARVLATLMKAYGHPGHLMLFDSFGPGMPKADNPIDAACPEMATGVWREGMTQPVSPDIERLIYRSLSCLLPGRVTTNRGWFKDTMVALPSEPPSIVHIDCDLYESTLTVLTAMVERNLLRQGQVFLFDDWNNGLASDKFGERAAVRDSGILFEPWFSYGWQSQAMIVQDI